MSLLSTMTLIASGQSLGWLGAQYLLNFLRMTAHLSGCISQGAKPQTLHRRPMCLQVPTLSWAGVSRLVLLCPELQHLCVGECAALQDFGLDRLLHAVLTDKRLAGLHVSLEEPHA